MGILDKIKSTVDAVTPDQVGDLLLGETKRPPAPTDASEAQSLIDRAIGREPTDYTTIDRMKSLGQLSLALKTDPTSLGLPSTAGYYDADTRARFATNNLNSPIEPYMVADRALMTYAGRDDRTTLLYLRENDPLNPQLTPYLVESNMENHPGIFSKAKSVAGDLLGRPIGGALELLARPAAEVETWFGSTFVWNDIGDASLRHAMAKYTYESRLNLKDWDLTWEQQARAKANEIESQGLTGDAAAASFEAWVKTDEGHLPMTAYVSDLFGQIVLDPLWLVPTGFIATQGGKGAAKVLGTSDLGKLGRLGTSAGRQFWGEHTLKELMTMPELAYANKKLGSPGARGPLLMLTERTPDRLGDAALKETASLISGPMLNARDPYERLQVIAHFDETLRNGKISPAAAAIFGDKFLDNPVLAALQVHTATQKRSIMEGLLEGVTKNPEVLQATPEEQNFLLLNHIGGVVRSVARDGQMSVFPKWFTQRYLPVVAAQKMMMGVFSLSRPGFVVLNMANNWFTYMWHAARHPVDGTKMFATSFKAEMSTIRRDGGHLPENFRKLATAAGIDPMAVERTVVGNVSHQDVLGQKLGYPFRLDDEAIDLPNAMKLARKAVHQPIKDLNPMRFGDLIAMPVTIAGRIDRLTRRAGFYHNLSEQMLLGTSPNRIIGGIIPDVRSDLTKLGVAEEDASRIEGQMISHMRSYIFNGGSLNDPRAIRESWLKATEAALGDTPAAKLSAYDLGLRFARRLGYSEEASVHWLRDLDPVMQRIHDDIFSRLGNEPLTQINARLDSLADEYWEFDRVQAEMTKTDPILRGSTDYSAGLQLTEQGLRDDLKDTLLHIERLVSTKLPDWAGNAPLRRSIIKVSRDYSVGRLNRLGRIRRNKLMALADPQGHVFDETAAWKEYFEYTDDINLKLYETTKAALSRVDTTNLKPLDDWYAGLLKAQRRHREIIADARNADTPEAWAQAGKDVARIYTQAANRRSAIFGWAPNDEAKNLGHTRPTAAFTAHVDEYIDFVRAELPRELAKPQVAAEIGSLRQTLRNHANTVADAAPQVARQLVSNARAKTDFMMLNYNNQYGIDSILQMVFPYEFFPTRTAANWGIRTMRSPGAAAWLAKMVLLPNQYAKDYNMPERLGYKIPIPMPFLDEFLNNLPVIGPKVRNANFGGVYWVDPLAMMFPMTSFRDNYDDERRRSTPMGVVADWAEQNTPLSFSPFAKIIGGATGDLDRDAWTNSLFNGGPFGIPSSAYGNAAANWIQTGDGSGVPEEEKENYSNGGFFSSKFLRGIFGMEPDRYDKYRTERALASLVAEKKIGAEDAWEALKTGEGPAWDMANKAGDSEKFLADFTGWAGFRVTGSLQGEQIRLGTKSLYTQALEGGDLEAFYDKFPEFEIQNVAAKGLEDPKEQAVLIDTHMYFRDSELLVNQPFQKALDDLEARITDITSRDGTFTETDNEQLSFYEEQVYAIKGQQAEIRAQLDAAYPDRKKDRSLFADPRQRALQEVASGWYDLIQTENETFEEFEARRQAWLDGFSPRTSDESEMDWQTINTAFLTTRAVWNLKINKFADSAAGKSGFDPSTNQTAYLNKLESLREERDRALLAIHNVAQQRVTRYDLEQYISSFKRTPSAAELEWQQADDLFDTWMSYMGDSSPLSSKQKAAVSAYFRAQPLLRKHYNVGTIDINTLNGDQLLALARRREIRKHYSGLATNEAKIDYMRAVGEEYNEANDILGLPHLDILDYRPTPPGVNLMSAEAAAEDFYLSQNASEAAGAPDQMSSVIGAEDGLSLDDINRYVDAAIQRGS